MNKSRNGFNTSQYVQRRGSYLLAQEDTDFLVKFYINKDNAISEEGTYDKRGLFGY
jgi:hypothetical protein